MQYQQLGQQLGATYSMYSGASSSATAGTSSAAGWGSVIGGVIDLGMTIYNGRQALKQQQEQFNVIRQRNTLVMQEMMRSLATIEQDRSLELMRLQSSLRGIRAEVRTAKADTDVALAAAGMRGASFDALRNSLEVQEADATARLMLNAETSEQQRRLQQRSVVNSALNATQNVSGTVQGFDFSTALAGLGSAAAAGLQGYQNWRQRSPSAAPQQTVLQDASRNWVPAGYAPAARDSISSGSGISFNLGLY